jgi:hypothetical protein
MTWNATKIEVIRLNSKSTNLEERAQVKEREFKGESKFKKEREREREGEREICSVPYRQETKRKMIAFYKI